MFTFLNKETIAKATHRMASVAVALIALFGGVQANAEATLLKSFDNGYMDMAIDGEEFHLCFRESAEDKVTIIDNNFNVVETISLEGKLEENERITSLYVSHFDTGDIAASRGLFTTDGKWCVVVRDSSTSNYAVYNSDGNKIIDSLPASSYGDPGDVWLKNIHSGKPYYVTKIGDLKYYSYNVWSFTGGSSAGITAQIVNTVAAYPNPLPAGASLTINLPKEADSHTIVTIADMNGRQVLRRTVENLATEISISPRFCHGAYIYTVIYSDGTSFSGKVATE